jgi:hypothetical protein
MLEKGAQRTAPYTLTERARNFLNSAYKEDRSQYSQADQEPELFEVNTQIGADFTSFTREVTPHVTSYSNQGSKQEVATYADLTYRSVEGYNDDTWGEVKQEVTGEQVTSSPLSPPLGGEKGVTEGRKEGSNIEVVTTSNQSNFDWAYVLKCYANSELKAIQTHCILNRTDYASVLAELQNPGKDEEE